MKPILHFFYLISVLCCFNSYTISQIQIGTDINGESGFDQSGVVSMSADGTIVAIGAFTNDGTGTNAGHVRVYENVAGTWTQIGTDIDGEAAGDESGKSISLNNDGTVLAIGADRNDGSFGNAGHVRVYENSAGTWTQIGTDIDGEASSDQSGFSVSLNDDGTILAIGAPYNDAAGTNAGQVRIYQNLGGVWTQIGGDIDGEAAGDQSGFSVSLSNDGTRVAIGAPFNTNGGAVKGHVRIYENMGGTWTQLGGDIDGEGSGDQSGFSVSLNGDGTKIAIGANLNDAGGSNAGYTRVYEISGGTWVQIGASINGEAAGDESGKSVSLNNDGNRVVIGAPSNDGSGSNAGHVRLYENIGGTWTQLGLDVDGENSGDHSGQFIGMDNEGYFVAIGAIDNDETAISAGHVRIYHFCTDIVTSISEIELCQNEPLTIEGTSSTGGAITWNNGAVNGVPFLPLSTGSITYTMSSTSAGDCAFSTDITVNPLPTVTATAADDEVCDGGLTTLTGGGAVSYVWEDGITDGTAFAPPVGTTTYSVTGTDLNGCENTTDIDIMVNPLPTVTATADDDEVCDGGLTTLTGGGAVSYVWEDGITDGTAFAPPVGTTTYSVTGTDLNGCENTADIDIMVNPLPTVTATATDDEVCDGGLVTLTGGGAVSYVWEDGITDGTAFAPPVGTTTYSVTGTDLNGCENTADIDIMVNPLPTVTATATDDEVCDGGLVTLTGGGAVSYVWEDGITDGTAFAPPVGTTTYSVTGTDLNGCENTADIDIMVNPLPTVTATADDDEVCDGGLVTLTGGGAVSYVWEDGITDGTAFAPPVGTTTYSVMGTDLNGCENTTDIDIMVNPLPTVTATADDDEVCDGGLVTLTGGGAVSYVWEDGITDGTAFAPPVGTTTYSVTGTDLNGCENTVSIDIMVNPLPTVTATADDDEVCDGGLVTLTGGGAVSYVWEDGITDGTAFAPPVGTTTYSVTGTDLNGCENTVSIDIVVFPGLELTFISTDELEGGDGEINLTVTGGNPPYSFDWDNDESGDFDDTEDLTDISGGTYTVVVEDNAGCQISETINVDSQLGIAHLNSIQINSYPNPTQSTVVIELKGTFHYELMTLDGRIIIQGKEQDELQLDLSMIPDGVYLFTANLNGKKSTIRIVKI